jgi:hypothetical protein
LTHDKAVEMLLHEHKIADKKHYTDLFLSGLSGPFLHGGLCVYAVSKNIPAHTHLYTGKEPRSYRDLVNCQICGAYRTNTTYDSISRYDLFLR